MTVQLRPAITAAIAGSLATAAILLQAPQASARIATASLVAMNSNAIAQTDTVSPTHNQPCEDPKQSTIQSEATASLAALGSDSPLAQASVLIVGLGCLTGGSLLLKRNCQ